jgi:hypothetical protein
MKWNKAWKQEKLKALLGLPLKSSKSQSQVSQANSSIEGRKGFSFNLLTTWWFFVQNLPA